MADPAVQSATSTIASLVEEYGSLMAAMPEKDVRAESLYPVLFARDRIAAARDVGSLTFDLAKRLQELDTKLKRVLDNVRLEDVQSLKDLRESIQPPGENWWWHREPAPSPWWTIAALVFLTCSVTLITDFTRRILGNDPDELGIGSIAVQALLGVAATSTFTEGGKRWLASLVNKRVKPELQPLLKLGASVVLFVVVAGIWNFLPHALAAHYNRRSMNATPSKRIRDLNRAIALDPELTQVHYNLGETYEDSYQYDKATAEYQEALVLDFRNVKAHANLSRLLVIAGQAYTALRVADDGVNSALQAPAQAQESDEAKQSTAAAYKARAWAELDLGFYADAEADANRAKAVPIVAPGALCLLGKIYAKENRTQDAQQAWKDFNPALTAADIWAGVHKLPAPVPEPDCTRLAEEAQSGKN